MVSAVQLTVFAVYSDGREVDLGLKGYGYVPWLLELMSKADRTGLVGYNIRYEVVDV